MQQPPDLSVEQSGHGTRFVGFTAAPTEGMHGAWRALPLILYVLLAVCALLTSFGVGVTTTRLQGKCLLYARPGVSLDPAAGNVTLYENAEGRWGSENTCLVAEYLPVFAFIFAGVWFFFFCMCGKGGKGSSEGFAIDNPWRIVFPALLFHVAMSVASLICAVSISDGINLFCRSAHEKSGGKFRCELMDGYVFNKHADISHLWSWLLLINVSGWLVFVGYLLLTLLLVFRCVCRPDLQPIYTTITPPPGTAPATLPNTGSADSFLSAGSVLARTEGCSHVPPQH